MPTVSFTNSASIMVPSGNSILEEAIRSGINLAYSCSNGRCGTCKARILAGKSILLGDESSLSAEEKNSGWILTCVRAPLEDLTLDADIFEDIHFPIARIYPCRISSIEVITSDILKVFLLLPPKNNFTFIPGQFIDLIAPDGLQRSYSIAGLNKELNLLELHVRIVKEGKMSDYLVNKAKINDLLRFHGPKGTFSLRKDVIGMDLFFLATGTGIAPIKAMIEYINKLPVNELPRSVTIIWGNRKLEDLYLDTHFNTYNYIPVLSQPDFDWDGKIGYVQNILVDISPKWENSLVYACGSAKMITTARELLSSLGLHKKHFISESFLPSIK